MSAPRIDVWTRRGLGEWRLTVPAVTPANAHRMARAMEAGGEQVRLCTLALGCVVYQTREPGSVS
jgi:hypothetical protein